MKKYLICNNGSEDTTYTELFLTTKEIETIIRFANMNNVMASSDKCKPTISIYLEYKKVAIDDYQYKNNLVDIEGDD